MAIAKRPIITIACVLAAAFACAAGLVKFYEVDASDPIWVDPKSMYIKHKTWVDDTFPSQLRLSFYIAEGDNLLTPSAILEVREHAYCYRNISFTSLFIIIVFHNNPSAVLNKGYFHCIT